MKAIRCALALVAFLAVADAWGLMKEGAVHNFNDGLGNDGWYSRDNSCAACHIPLEKPEEEAKPRWDPEYAYQVFPLYSSGDLKKRHADMSSTTLMCMGCHDGSIAPEYVMENAMSPSWFKRNHPVGIKYDRNLLASKYDQLLHLKKKEEMEPSGDPVKDFLIWAADLPDTYPRDVAFSRLKPPGEVTLPLYKGRIECTTCHDPHQSNHNLLRGDTLNWPCGECHIM